jgi:hypothetical protein
MTIQTMTSIKIKYFKYHLTISLLVVLTLSVICQFFWFPMPFLFIDGTWVALLIIAAVDIVLGPLLTLLLIKQDKSRKERLVDLSVIAILQLSALVYGLSQIEQERVVALVHSEGAFNLVPKKELAESEIAYLKDFPQYHGIYYAMVVSTDLVAHATTSNSKPFIYSPLMYRELNQKEILNTPYLYTKLPKKIKEKYNKQYIFKGLAGKKQNAVLVLTQEMTLIDIMLLPTD